MKCLALRGPVHFGHFEVSKLTLLPERTLGNVGNLSVKVEALLVCQEQKRQEAVGNGNLGEVVWIHIARQ